MIEVITAEREEMGEEVSEVTGYTKKLYQRG